MKFEADHLRRDHIDRLTEHDGFGFDAADAPADDAETVDHRGVRIGADERIGKENAVAREDTLREIFEIDLMHDAGGGRDDAEILKRLWAPFQKFIAFAVALKFDLRVFRSARIRRRKNPPAPNGQ